MRYDLKKPCANCPFLREGGIRLHPGRAEDITGMMLDPSGGTFACHKTVEHDDEGDQVNSHNEQHCAGALLFAINNDNYTQMMRILTRTGWDPESMIGHDLIVDDADGMTEHRPARCPAHTRDADGRFHAR